MNDRQFYARMALIDSQKHLDAVKRKQRAFHATHKWPVQKSAVITWAVWVILTLGSFAVIEARALANARQGDTLSEILRFWWHTHTTGGKVAWYVVSVAFVAWFIPHVGANDWVKALLS